MSRPLYVYDNWSAYDELSDNVPLTEELAMRELAEVQRLRKLGVTIDAYLMDAFWYEPEGGYRTWRADRWPNGPEAWLEGCQAAGLLPGLWFPANTAFFLTPPAEWRDSLAENAYGFCCFEGGFMAGFVEVLDHWYQRGVRVYKFDFAEFSAVPKGSKVAPEDAKRKNIDAYRRAILDFRQSHTEVVLLAYNGFEHTEYMPTSEQPVRPVLDKAWLDVFDTIYCGDPRTADIPLPNFWRTLDIYADAMTFLLHRGSGLGLADIDNCAFMIGNCGTCYRRGAVNWRTTALLSYARGGRVHMVLGNLEALSDTDAEWLAEVQTLFERAGTPAWVGGNPGKGDLYGLKAGDLITTVNQSLENRKLAVGEGRILYSDGFVEKTAGVLELGPGAVALVGEQETALGSGEGPRLILAPIDTAWMDQGNVCEGTVRVPKGSSLHLVFQQRDADGKLVRTTGGSPPDGIPSDQLLKISATQSGRLLPVSRNDNRPIWSGMSWAYGAVAAEDLTVEPVHVRFEATDQTVKRIVPAAYAAK